MATKPRYTRRDFEAEFPTEDACLEWLFQFLYPAGVECRNCKRVTKHHRVKGRKSYSCQECGHHVHPTAGTIYHKSSTPLREWFYAVFLMSSTRCGISAKQLERELGVTYKTAWRMFKLIRSMLTEDGGKLGGQVEVDETFVAHASKANRKKGRGTQGKSVIVGAVERGGRVRTRVVSDTTIKSLRPFINKSVEKGSAVYTDEWKSYRRLGQFGFDHSTVRHGDGVYVVGITHTNTIEGFWGNFKGGLRGVYKHCGREYLQSYVNEFAFRYNRRNSEVPMFQHFMAQHEQAEWWTPYTERD